MKQKKISSDLRPECLVCESYDPDNYCCGCSIYDSLDTCCIMSEEELEKERKESKKEISPFWKKVYEERRGIENDNIG